ncbi:actin-binding protein IPP-like [Stylophora pistillata]|uniref:Actin-binding protein IPP n=1 Tax=Stylophora pistillata TaxID=50429 RepID=A0A2B4SDT6_STYPI|nr:actin-binding protein IPP-like [Stylophora pistillata]PFX28041.1 Actin-binding protein IPP [Stylophora pistillata]
MENHRTVKIDKISFAKEHSFKVLNKLHLLQKENSMCDATLSVGGKKFPVHRNVLSASSAYFQVMFTSGMAESFADHVEIHGIQADIFGVILEFIYTGKVEVSEDNVQQLLPASKMLQIEDIEIICCDFLKRELDSSNCVGIYTFSDAHSCLTLSKSALDFIHRNFVEVSKQDEFLQLTKTALLQMLESEDLKIESEEQVFEAAMRWVVHDLSRGREALGNILERIRLPLVSPKFLEQYLVTCQSASIKRMLAGILDGYRNYQSLTRGQQRVHTQPRRASRKCLFIIGGYSRHVGGRWSDTSSLYTVEKFDSFLQTCDSFTTVQMSFARSSHAVASIGGLIYAIGGENDSLIYDTVECYDPVLNSWSVIAPLTAPRVACGVCVVEDFMFVIGGWVGSEIAENIERYDPDLDQWEVVGKVETKRFHLGVAEMDGLIYVAGGLSDLGEELKVCECYNPVSDSWIRQPDMRHRRAYLGLATVGGFLYAVGGSNESEGALASVERFDLDTSQWTEVTPMESPRAGLSVAVSSGLLYVFGGRTASEEYSPPATLTAVDMYDPKKKKWKHVTDLCFSRCDFGIGIV